MHISAVSSFSVAVSLAGTTVSAYDGRWFERRHVREFHLPQLFPRSAADQIVTETSPPTLIPTCSSHVSRSLDTTDTTWVTNGTILPSTSPTLASTGNPTLTASSNPTLASSATPSASSTNPTSDWSDIPWTFDPDYDPDAIFTYDFEKIRALSTEMWQKRQIGDWLIEYSIRHGIADSDNFFHDLVNLNAFDAPYLTCRIDDTNCHVSPGTAQSGLPNDRFNALLVLSATASFTQWFQSIRSALENARGEFALILDKMASDILPTITQPTPFWSLSNGFFSDAISFALLFNPAGALIADFARDAVVSKMFNEYGSFVGEGGLDSIHDAIDRTAKDLTGQFNAATSKIDKGWKVIRDVLPFMPSTGGQPLSSQKPDTGSYKLWVASEITFFEAQFGNALDRILNWGFNSGGLISQIYNGNYVVPWHDDGSFLDDEASEAAAEVIHLIGAQAGKSPIAPSKPGISQTRNERSYLSNSVRHGENKQCHLGQTRQILHRRPAGCLHGDLPG